MDWNLFDGTVPSALANCSSLLYLSLQGNALRGVLPAAIGELPGLQVLSLSHNNLSGLVPSSVLYNVSGNPPSLRIVQLGFNAFTGIVRPERAQVFSALQVLDLQENRIQGEFPSWLANISTLSFLDLSSNSFSGSLPAEIGDLSLLQELRVARNLMNGEIPTELRRCVSLQVLDLEDNSLSGVIPDFLAELRDLRTLSLGGNLFSGLIPAGLRNLSRLDVLSLGGNELTGNLPEELMQLINLTVLNLSNNRISGEISPRIGELQQLQSLNLSGNGFVIGRIPPSIGNLLKLRSLDMSRMNLTGEPPMELAGLPNLQVLSLSENSFSGNVPEGFSSLLSLQHLNLSSNAFRGDIPATYGYLRSLVVLSLSNNNVSGAIPEELGNCSDLAVFQLRNNRLSGHIPLDLSRLARLRELDLGQNALTGMLPPEISNCTALIFLQVDRNRLSGVIPDSLSDLSNLQRLDLSANNFTGAIPANLTRLSALSYLNVSRNNLEGEIPAMLGSRFNDPGLFAMNRNLCGNPLATKCRGGEEKGRGGGGGRRKRQRWIIWASIAVGVPCIVALCGCCCIFGLIQWRKRVREANGEKKRSPSRVSGGTERSSVENGGPKLVMFNTKITYAETVEATRQFDEENVLSRGRHGLVFKASFQDGTVLSIRRLPDGLVEEAAFRKEAESLGKVKHRNLTVLRGYYAGPPPGIRLLVYDYMPNGNLATLLQEASHQDGHVLNWPMRHLIALGVARGLGYLHSCSMVHGDVKPQNVLFDADFEAHLSDFGLERLAMPTSEAVAAASTSAMAVGSLGYVSPESALTGQASKEADVYSFGIVLLELLTGRRPVMFSSSAAAGEGEEDEDIVKWVKRMLQRGQIAELLEPGLLELDPESSEWEEFLLGVKVGLLCTTPDPADRPSMADIVFMLEGCRVAPDMPSSADPTSHPSPST